jgi:hypothetical protein
MGITNVDHDPVCIDDPVVVTDRVDGIGDQHVPVTLLRMKRNVFENNEKMGIDWNM